MIRQLPWLRITAEGIAIVVSILLAFGIQAWWEERQQQADEQQLIESLHAEFSETRGAVEFALERHRNSQRAAEQVAMFAASDGSDPQPDFRTVHAVFVRYATTHLTTGVLDGVLSAGRLGLISDPELRALLAAWPSVLDEFREQEEEIIQLRYRTRDAFVATTPLADELLHWQDATGPLPSGVLEFIKSSVGQNYAATRAGEESLAVRDGEALLNWLDDLIALLREKLES